MLTVGNLIVFKNFIRHFLGIQSKEEEIWYKNNTLIKTVHKKKKDKEVNRLEEITDMKVDN